jgi:2-polyprenyl-3-methyl-5-hydroxy-6-metoxy-1,4-benzoquinol methylase
MPDDWNHNIHYHGVILSSVPPNCQSVLDVGCGQGLLARQLARHCRRVTAIDVDSETLLRGIAAGDAGGRITFVQGDVLTHPFGDNSFDMISVVATLHHLPLTAALSRLRNLLRPGGVLAVVGLYRLNTARDFAYAAAGKPASLVLRRFRSCAPVTAPLQEPRETLGEIRTSCDALLPGNRFRRHLLFRYSMIWRKP